MFILAFLLAGLSLIALGLWCRGMTRQCARWPSAEGVILESAVEDADLENMRPRVRYRYTVGSLEFTSWRVSYSGYGSSRRAMQGYIARHREGKPARVYYDPSAPERSVLENDARSDWLLWFAAGVAFCLCSVFLAAI